VVSDERKPDGTGLVTMGDPEGNQFGRVVHASRDTVALDLALALVEHVADHGRPPADVAWEIDR